MSFDKCSDQSTTRWTLADLRRWIDNGATWRLMPRAPEPPLIELCTCYGEAVDVVEPAPDLIEALERREIMAEGE